MTGQAVAATERTGVTRLLLVGAILLGEYLALSFAFDARVVSTRGGVWTVFAQAGALGPLLVAAGAALLLIGPGLVTGGLPPQRAVRPWPSILHVASTAAFFWATQLLFDGETVPAGPAIAWLLVWALTGLCSFATLLLAGVGDLPWVLKTLSRALMAGGLLGLLAWGAGILAGVLWVPLSATTFRTVAWILSALGADLEIDFETRVLGLDGFRISVAPICSGIEGLGLFVVLMSAFLVQQRKTYRFPNALLVLPLGMLLTWLGNCVRIAGLMLLGAHVDADVAIGSFHSKAGWVFFCAITIGLAAVSRKVPWFSQSRAAEPKVLIGNPVAPWISPLLTWIAVSLALSALSNGHDPYYALRVLIVGALLWAYRDHYARLIAWPSALAWIVGTLVGVGWLLVPTDAESVPPVPSWSDPAYYGWLVTRTLGAVVVIPIAEELAFRGYLTRLLTRRDFENVPFREVSWLAILGSSLAFGALHQRWEMAAVTGVLYALLCRSSGRLIDSVAAHAASNAVIAVWVLATHEWQHW
jgi:exosortase E/protease (VPEID-CTERM system)